MTSAFTLVTERRAGTVMKTKLLKRVLAISALAEAGTKCSTAAVWGLRAWNRGNSSATSGKTKAFREEV